MRNFRNYNVWQESMRLVKEVYLLSEKLPSNEKYGLRSQITRAAVSIPANIAEGCSRNSDIEFKRFLEIALGSAFELETHLLIIQDLSLLNYDYTEISEFLNKVQKMLNQFISKIKLDKITKS
jgi:four helix bundle protein